MKRKLFVHIGMPKAGSTSIQAMLGQWPAYFERAGVHVAVAGRQAGRHSQLYGEDDEPKPSAWNDLLHELTRCAAPRFVISWEPFAIYGRIPGRQRSSGSCAADIAALAKAADVDVQVIAYVRPQYQYIESLYCERVKMARQAYPLGVFFEKCLRSPRFDYNWVLEPWQDTFGERLVICPLERASAAYDVRKHFLSVIGVVDPALAGVQQRENPRIGAKHVEVLRLAGAALSTQAVDRRTRARLLEPLRAQVPALLAADLPFAGLTPEQVVSVDEHYANSNARFARQYGIDTDGVLFRRPADGLVRPAIAEATDFSEVERSRLCQLIAAVLGEDIAEIVGASLQVRPHRRPPVVRWPSAKPSCAAERPRGALAPPRQHFTWDAIQLSCKRLLRRAGSVCGQARSIRDVPSLVAYLRWLRWELEVRWRKLSFASGNESAARTAGAANR